MADTDKTFKKGGHLMIFRASDMNSTFGFSTKRCASLVTFGYKKCRMDMEIVIGMLREFLDNRYWHNVQTKLSFHASYTIRYE